MIVPYLPRLLCISLATFFLVHLSLGTIIFLIAPAAVRWADRIAPHVAARCLLALRLLPAVGAACVVAVVCVPSYLWLEPEAPTERVGFGCLSAALLAMATWSVSLARGLRATASSRRFVQDCRQAGRLTRIHGETADAWIVDGPAPLLALAGIFRPRLIISRGVLAALPAEQRKPLELAFFSDLTHVEIAAKLGTPLGTIKTRIRTAMRTLKETLGDGPEAAAGHAI